MRRIARGRWSFSGRIGHGFRRLSARLRWRRIGSFALLVSTRGAFRVITCPPRQRLKLMPMWPGERVHRDASRQFTAAGIHPAVRARAVTGVTSSCGQDDGVGPQREFFARADASDLNARGTRSDGRTAAAVSGGWIEHRARLRRLRTCVVGQVFRPAMARQTQVPPHEQRFILASRSRAGSRARPVPAQAALAYTHVSP